MVKSIAERTRPYLVAPTVVFGVVVPILACSWNDARFGADLMPLRAGPVRPAHDFSTGVEALRYDPIELLRRAQQRCAQEVRDYTCVFLRQERVAGQLTAPQAIKVLYREDPQSVYMTWIQNTGRVKRALYVKGRLVNEHGEEEALVEPAGVIARLLVRQLEVPIHGAEARKSGRFTIDEFGFRVVLDRILRDNQRLTALGAVEWTYEGRGSIDGRPTYVLVRHLPYAGSKGRWPDARLVVHLDQQWLWPVGVYSFADEQERELLGSYVTTSVDLNPGLTDANFQF
jgi:hypothetical protein